MQKVVISFTFTALLLTAAVAEAGISSIVAHGDSFSPGATIPVFVDTARNSITVRGSLMDTCIGVESSDGSFSASIGRRVAGSNSSVEILVGAGSAPDQDGATIHIKFVLGEETFRVRAFKTRVDSMFLFGAKGVPSCKAGETVMLVVRGEGMDHLAFGTAGAMLDVADNRFRLQGSTGTPTSGLAQFVVQCTAVGQFTARDDWFRDSRLSGPSADAMVRGAASLTVTVEAP
jgi:hypothetical protein